MKRCLGILKCVLVSVALCASTAAAQAVATPDGTAASEALGASLLANSAPPTRALTANDDTTRPALQQRDPRYRLCASDVMALTFANTPEFDQTVNVQPDGFISLTGLNDVHVEGMTTAEAATAIKSAYSKILENPQLSIELKDFNKPYFMVNGQVYKPGKFDLRGYTTASQAIALAGGFQDTAKHSQVLLFRRANDSWYEVKTLDMKSILQGHNVNEDPEIRPGDLLFVPQNLISKIKKFIPNYGMGAYSEFHP
jgi:polysaccharide biosynthesis/export protein